MTSSSGSIGMLTISKSLFGTASLGSALGWQDLQLDFAGVESAQVMIRVSVG